MTSRAAFRLITAVYPRQWRRDGRTEEMLEVLIARSASQPTRTARWSEATNAVAHGLSARVHTMVGRAVRLRVAQFSLASSSGLAVMLLLLAEWLPGRSVTAFSRFGPFVTPGVLLYLSIIATAVLVLVRARRVAGMLAGLNVVGPPLLLLVPHLTDQTRPSAPALAALELLAVGVVVGWADLNQGPARSTCPAAAGLTIGGATWFTNRTISPDDDRLAFYGPHGGLDNVASVSVLGVAAVVVLGLAAAAHDRSWLTGALITSVAWAALGARVIGGSDGPALLTAYIIAWIVAAGGLIAHQSLTTRRARTAARA